MGNPKKPSYGVDPGAEQQALLSQLQLAFKSFMYVAKIMLPTQLIKQFFFRLVLDVPTRTYLNPFAALISGCFWDTLICAVIMEQ
eukprot:SAG11_NODE_23621_length_385_cov_1.087413_1_plen_84_part_10